LFLRPNGPELSCGGEQLNHRELYARPKELFPKNFFARGEIIDGYFRQLERLVRAHMQVYIIFQKKK